MKPKKKGPHFTKYPSGNVLRVNLSLDPEAYEAAQKILHAKGFSVSEKVSEFLKQIAAKERGGG